MTTRQARLDEVRESREYEVAAEGYRRGYRRGYRQAVTDYAPLRAAAKAALDAIKQEFLYQTGQTVRPGRQYPPQGTVCSALADVVQQLRAAIAAIEGTMSRTP